MAKRFINLKYMGLIKYTRLFGTLQSTYNSPRRDGLNHRDSVNTLRAGTLAETGIGLNIMGSRFRYL